MNTTGTPHTSVKTYLLVFGGLALLTGLTVVLSYMGLSTKVAVVAASLIALVKCSLIGAFFMHLRTESKMIYWIFFTAIVGILVLLLAVLPDLGLR